VWVRVRVEGERGTDGEPIGRVGARIRVAYQTLAGKRRERLFSQHRLLTSPGFFEYLLEHLPKLRRVTCTNVKKYSEGTTCAGCGRPVERINYRWHPSTRTTTPSHAWFVED